MEEKYREYREDGKERRNLRVTASWWRSDPPPWKLKWKHILYRVAEQNHPVGLGG
jgi:hypothetical protein